ncbi:MAG: MerR family transcriptional regulator [Deltaproteobacteria bacterium]|nr:MerR family transcriptional regulator [Deltaproteobacteria bacterium]
MLQIPENRRYFRIGEASRIVGVAPYVLRYWESEFPQVRPKRADSNQRTYQRKELEMLLDIKRLLYDEKMTIEGARRALSRGGPHRSGPGFPLMEEIKRELYTVLDMLR